MLCIIFNENCLRNCIPGITGIRINNILSQSYHPAVNIGSKMITKTINCIIFPFFKAGFESKTISKTITNIACLFPFSFCSNCEFRFYKFNSPCQPKRHNKIVVCTFQIPAKFGSRHHTKANIGRTKLINNPRLNA